MAKVLVVAGLGFGDEGKGTTVDFLTRQHKAHTVVRYNGGAQAAHNVVTPDGRHHTFAQFGSGTFAGAATHLSRFMMVNPIFMMREAACLVESGVADPFGKVTVEAGALVTTPYHIAANRLRELARGKNRHGSCGIGIGETVDFNARHPEFALRVGDIAAPMELIAKLDMTRKILREQFVGVWLDRGRHADRDVRGELAVFEDSASLENFIHLYQEWHSRVRVVDEHYLSMLLDDPGCVVFEGAQGLLIDQKYGFHPHTTWSDCTFANADALMKPVDPWPRKYIGVTRAYATRHGPGPFVTETRDLAKARDEHNDAGKWQGPMRYGHLDLVTLDYSLRILNCVTDIAMTCIDHVKLPVACAWYNHRGSTYAHLSPNDSERTEMLHFLEQCEPTYYKWRTVHEFIDEVEQRLCTPISVTSYGPSADDKVIR